jgi:hypothetical protein
VTSFITNGTRLVTDQEIKAGEERTKQRDIRDYTCKKADNYDSNSTDKLLDVIKELIKSANSVSESVKHLSRRIEQVSVEVSKTKRKEVVQESEDSYTEDEEEKSDSEEDEEEKSDSEEENIPLKRLLR